MIDICAKLRAERRSAGRELQMADAWIAATALLLDCPLASHDIHFVGIPNLQLIRDPSL
jgi:predicted nucleic acid-binding protein